MHAIATSQPSVSGSTPASGAVRDVMRDKDNAAKDDASFDSLVTAAQQDERPDAPSDAPKAHAASTADKTKPQEKATRKAADDSDHAEADASAQAAPAPDAAPDKPRLHAALNEEAAGVAQEPVAASTDSTAAAIAQADPAQTGQAVPPQDQAVQAALAATVTPKAAAPADATADKKTNGVQASGQHAEQRSDTTDAMPGGKPVEQASTPNDQNQNQDQAGAKDSAASKPDQPARPDQTAEIRPDTKDAGIKPLMDTARAEMAPEAAPRPQVQAPATNMAVSGLVGLDTNAPTQGTTPASIQHVQVTAQDEAAPDLPRLAVDITARSHGGAKQFDIRLDPPELGRVEVRLSIDHDGKTSAHLTAEQPRTLDLLQRDSVLLARALRDAGLDVSQDNLNFSLRQQAQDSGHNLAGHHGQGQGRGSRGLPLAASRTIEATATSAAWRTPSDGRLDIRV